MAASSCLRLVNPANSCPPALLYKGIEPAISGFFRLPLSVTCPSHPDPPLNINEVSAST